METYIARTWLEEGEWAIQIPGLGAYPDGPEEGLPTAAYTFEDVKPMARDAIALYLDVPIDSFHVEVRINN